MAKRRSSAVRVTGPRLRVGKRGIRVQAPRARIGGKTGINISKSGASASVRTKAGTFNTKRGLGRRRKTGPPGCVLPMLALLALLAATLACGNTGSTSTTPAAVAEQPTQRPTFTPIPAGGESPTEAPPPAPTAAGPTAEPSPTSPPTDTPVPTEPPPPPLVLQGVTAHSLSYGGYEIVGEAINQSTDILHFVKIVASCYDADKRIVATDYSYTELDILEAGGRSPFSVTFMEAPPGLDSYKLDVEWRLTTEVPLHVDILSHSGGSLSYGGYEVVGEVHNPYDFDLEFVKIVGTFYNAANEVLAVEYSYSELDTIGPDGTSPFDVTILTSPEGLDHYELQTQARRK